MNFQRDVEVELLSARRHHGPMHSLHEGYAVVLEELDEVKELVWSRKPKAKDVYAELVQVAAMAQRMAEDLLAAKLDREEVPSLT